MSIRVAEKRDERIPHAAVGATTRRGAHPAPSFGSKGESLAARFRAPGFVTNRAMIESTIRTVPANATMGRAVEALRRRMEESPRGIATVSAVMFDVLTPLPQPPEPRRGIAQRIRDIVGGGVNAATVLGCTAAYGTTRIVVGAVLAAAQRGVLDLDDDIDADVNEAPPPPDAFVRIQTGTDEIEAQP